MPILSLEHKFIKNDVIVLILFFKSIGVIIINIFIAINTKNLASLKQYFQTLNYFIKATFIFKDLRKYLRTDFARDLNFPQELEKDYHYHSLYYNRTKQYMHANHFFGELLCSLRGEPLTKTELMRFANLSSCAPIFDDFFETPTKLSHILALLEEPNLSNAQSKSETLAVHFLNNILASSIQKEEFLHAATQLFHAQTKSKTQKNNSLSKSELLEISLEKGGHSGSMYAYLLSGPRTADFYRMAYLLGGLGQLMDDIFDLYDDAKEGIRTFANQSNSVKEIRDILNNHKNKIFIQADILSKQDFDVSTFLQLLTIFDSTIEIALLQFEKIEKSLKTKPKDCLNLPRKTWIVDMEKITQVFRLFYLSAQKI